VINPSRRLQGIYIGGDNDPYLLGPRGAESEVGLYFIEFGLIYNKLYLETNFV
jgi:hypothetical protein